MISRAKSLLDSLAPFAAFPTTEALTTRYIPLALLVVLLAASLIKAVRLWGEIHDVEEPDTPSDLLASFQQAHAEGELDDAEFARVTEKLAGFSSAAAIADYSDRPRDASDSDRIVPHDGRLDKSPPSPRDSGATTQS
jgi:hypothetical protein